ncbi:MAG: ABC transporter substrate-binding protein [Phycisphaerae bacterium]
MARLLRLVVTTAAVAVAGWWLFADTVRHYHAPARDAYALRFAHFGTYQDYQVWQRVVEAFEQQHPTITVDQEYVVGMYGAYNTKIRQQMVAGTLPDAFLIQLGPFTHLAEQLADLTDLAHTTDGGLDLGQLSATGLEAFTAGGKLRALPVSGGNLLIYCNPVCFERASAHLGRAVDLPEDDWTVNEFRHLAELLTCDFDGDGLIDQFGFWQPRWIYYLPFLWSFGADLLNDTDSHWKFTGPRAEQALAFYQQMRVGQPVSPRPDQVAQMFQDTGFLTGMTAMCVNGPWFQPFLADSQLADRYHIAHVPTGPAGKATRVTWDGICMAQRLPEMRRANAWKFMRFVCSDRAQRILAATQRALPAYLPAADAFCEADAGRRSRKFIDALTYSRLQPITPFFRDMDRAINRHLGQLLREDQPITPAACLQALAADPRIASHFIVDGVSP